MRTRTPVLRYPPRLPTPLRAFVATGEFIARVDFTHVLEGYSISRKQAVISTLQDRPGIMLEA